MDSIVGKTLGHYRILSLLGEGGMGAVYKGRDLTLKRDVAIKVMHPYWSRQPNFRERFLQEAQVTANLDHPGIVKVHAFDEARGTLFIVMEFISGSNLRQMLDDLIAIRQWLPLSEAIGLVRQISLALDYAHHQGILHRDIKPANIMLKPQPAEGLPYRPIITDLGLAKLLEGQPLTQEGSSLGTPAYMSPEQALGQPTDPRSDVYSLGVLLYELAVGRLPFPAKTITEAIRFHTQEPPPAPRSIRLDLPISIEEVILKALNKNPAGRYPSAGELAKALEAVSSDAASVTSVATQLEAATSAEPISLLTQFQKSLIEPRGPSIIGEFPEVSPDQVQDRIQIMEANRTIRVVAIKPGGMSIGRGSENDIILSDTKASRQHAKLEFDGTRYSITDLQSTNGTYLGNVKLLPGVLAIWTPDKALRIGDTWFRLVTAKASTPGVTTGATGVTYFDASQIHSSAGEGRVGLFMETAQLSVEPGKSVIANLVLINQGTVVDHFRIDVEGIPKDWITPALPTIQLLPGEQREINLTITPPRTPQSRASRYPATFRATSQASPGQVAEVKGALTVGVFTLFSAEIQPQRIRAGQNGRVIIHNQGNIHENFTISLRDRANELQFRPPQSVVKVTEGQTSILEFGTLLVQRRWLGGEKSHAFSATVSIPQGDTQTLNGEIVSRALIPAWLPPILISLCMLLVLLAGMVYNFIYLPARHASETKVAQTSDCDHDGFPDYQEILFQSDPCKLDTDNDGLPDSQEKIWGTNPNLRDTDHDNLSDGDEVNKYKTDPNNPDTDGDGNRDDLDPDPGHPPTFTPTPTNTATPTLTSTPTLTPENTYTPTPTPTVTPTPTPTSFGGGTGSIAFSTVNHGVSSITIVNLAQGGSIRYLTAYSSDGGFFSWSPDGRLVAIASDREGNNEIYVINVDNPDQSVNITNNAAQDVNPAWSPEGARIAFASDREGTYDIFVANIDGSNIKNLTAELHGNEAFPAWSPDGKQIVFVSNDDVFYQVALVDADGCCKPVFITPQVEYAMIEPVWSPDGEKIAFVSQKTTDLNIYTMDVNGSNVQPITTSDSQDYAPVWSPDGNWLTYVTIPVHTGIPTIYRVKNDGAEKTEIPLGESIVEYISKLAWQPTSWPACEGNKFSRLHPGSQAVVAAYPPQNNRLRSGPSPSNELIGSIPPGDRVDILSGPQCSGEYIYWFVRWNGQEGWTAEAETNSYFLLPIP